MSEHFVPSCIEPALQPFKTQFTWSQDFDLIWMLSAITCIASTPISSYLVALIVNVFGIEFSYKVQIDEQTPLAHLTGWLDQGLWWELTHVCLFLQANHTMCIQVISCMTLQISSMHHLNSESLQVQDCGKHALNSGTSRCLQTKHF